VGKARRPRFVFPPLAESLEQCNDLRQSSGVMFSPPLFFLFPLVVDTHAANAGFLPAPAKRCSSPLPFFLPRNNIRRQKRLLPCPSSEGPPFSLLSSFLSGMTSAANAAPALTPPIALFPSRRRGNNRENKRAVLVNWATLFFFFFFFFFSHWDDSAATRGSFMSNQPDLSPFFSSFQPAGDDSPLTLHNRIQVRRLDRAETLLLFLFLIFFSPLLPPPSPAYLRTLRLLSLKQRDDLRQQTPAPLPISQVRDLPHPFVFPPSLCHCGNFIKQSPCPFFLSLPPSLQRERDKKERGTRLLTFPFSPSLPFFSLSRRLSRRLADGKGRMRLPLFFSLFFPFFSALGEMGKKSAAVAAEVSPPCLEIPTRSRGGLSFPSPFFFPFS